jgi:hypothetical protein
MDVLQANRPLILRTFSLPRALVCLAAFGLAACVDSPTADSAAVDENLLATSFDALSQEQIAQGDIERGEELRWTALALRAGAEPSRVEVRNGEHVQVFNVLAQAARWTQASLALRPAAYRAVVGWRKSGDTLNVVLITSSADVAQVTHPLTFRPPLPGGTVDIPGAVAHAAYFERGGLKAEWLGTSGTVRLSQRETGGACVAATTNQVPTSGVTCTTTRYLLGLDVTFRRAAPNSTQIESGSPSRRVRMNDQNISGARLTFACVSPNSYAGCQ